jgi:hypothetical protein
MSSRASVRLSLFSWHQAREAARKFVESKKMDVVRFHAAFLVQS